MGSGSKPIPILICQGGSGKTQGLGHISYEISRNLSSTTGPPCQHMSEQLQSLLDIAAGKQRGWQREKGESSLAEKSSWETRMHSGFFGEKEHAQPACHCHCNFQPRSHSCTGLRRDERHFIEESCFIFPSDICNRPRGMLQSIYVHWDTTTRSRLGFILLLSC